MIKTTTENVVKSFLQNDTESASNTIESKRFFCYSTLNKTFSYCSCVAVNWLNKIFVSEVIPSQIERILRKETSVFLLSVTDLRKLLISIQYLDISIELFLLHDQDTADIKQKTAIRSLNKIYQSLNIDNRHIINLDGMEDIVNDVIHDSKFTDYFRINKDFDQDALGIKGKRYGDHLFVTQADACLVLIHGYLRHKKLKS